MDPILHQLLKANDSPTDSEFPKGTDFAVYGARWRDVHHFKAAAEAVLGLPLLVDDQVQDASFFGELFVFEDGAVQPGCTNLVYKIAIRFSFFGRMATIHTNSEQSDLARYPVEKLAAALRAHNFVYVPAAALFEPYDGVMPPPEPNFTWWGRFFDYI